MRQIDDVTRGNEDLCVARRRRMGKRRRKAAHRAEPWCRIHKGRKAAPMPATDDDIGALGAQRLCHMRDERPPLPERLRLVCTEAAAAAAGEDGAQRPLAGQAVSSNSSRPMRKRRISEVPAPIS
jgi:hypothetical protein